MSRIFTAELSDFKEIISYIKEGSISLGFNDETVNTAHIVCDEFITNIIKNAYPNDVSDTRCVVGRTFKKPLQVSYSKTIDLNQLSIEFTDWGCPFNPLEYTDDSRDERTHGGLGIFIAKSLADCIKYHRTNRKNILTVFINSK